MTTSFADDHPESDQIDSLNGGNDMNAAIAWRSKLRQTKAAASCRTPRSRC